MANSFKVDVVGDGLKKDFLSISQIVQPFIKAAARVSADHITAEARARLQRQLSGQSTGQTVSSIVVKSDRTGFGWLVDSGNTRMPMLPRWLEFGTKQGAGRHPNRPRPYFYSSAALEVSAHRGRISAAIQAALSEHGLGDQR